MKGGGIRAGQWETTIDGTQVEVYGLPGGIPYQSMAEEKVTTVNAPAESRTPVTVDAVTKQGTNAFHGAVTLAFSHPALNALPAANPTSQRGPQVPYHTWNITAGGPLYIPKLYDGRNRTFLFVSAERNPPSDRQNYTYWTMPTNAMRQGDFSKYFAGTGRPTKQLKDPLTGAAFDGNVIPRSRWSPAAIKAIDNFFPAPNVPNTNPDVPYNNVSTLDRSVNSFSMLFVRLDQKISHQNTAGFSYNQSPQKSLGPGSFPSLPNGLGGSRWEAASKQFGWHDTHLFSPTIVNEFRLSTFIGDTFRNGNDGKTVGDTVSALGIDIGNNPVALKAKTAPNIKITGYPKFGPGYADEQQMRGWWQARNNLTIQRGHHSFKMGYDQRWNHYNKNSSGSFQIGGEQSFTGVYSGDPLADFLLGLPQTTIRFTPPGIPIYQLRFNELGLYFQDDFKVSSRLTLNLGVRTDRYSPRIERNGAYFNFDPKTLSIVVPDENSLKLVNPSFPSSVKITTAAQAGFPSTLTDPLFNVAPRFGFTYRLSGAGNAVVRGGYGIFAADSGFYDNKFRLPYTGGPFAVSQTFNNSITGGVPQLTLDHPFPSSPGQLSGNINVSGAIPNLGIPLMQQWNLTLERQFGADWGVRASYIGSRVTQGWYRRDINRPPASTIPFTTSRLLVPGFNSINLLDKGASSRYHALHLGFNHRYRNGFSIEGLFQWINSIDDVGDDGSDTLGRGIENPYCRSCEKSKTQFEDSLDFRTNFYYEMPFGRNRRFGTGVNRVVNGFIGNWVMSGVVDLRNGRPQTVTFSGLDTSNTNMKGGRADVVPGCEIRPSGGQREPYINIACFAIPKNGTFGNASRAAFRKPGSWDVSGSVYKYFPIFRESVKLRINATFNNLFNHPTWDEVGNNISVPSTFGKLTSQGATGRDAGPRSIGLQAQLQW
jgi:hypothetical protein